MNKSSKPTCEANYVKSCSTKPYKNIYTSDAGVMLGVGAIVVVGQIRMGAIGLIFYLGQPNVA